MNIEFSINATLCDTPVRGNAMASGDDDFDRQVEDDILRRLDAGDVWAWASVCVTTWHADIPGIKGHAHLGACCYKDESEFRECGYFDDLLRESIADLQRELRLADSRDYSMAIADADDWYESIRG